MGDSMQVIELVLLLAAFAIVPFALSMATSFAKLVIVGGLIRNALGTPQTPPNTVITGIALILTLHIMSPVIVQSWEAYQADATASVEAAEDDETATQVLVARLLRSAEEPLTNFLREHASDGNEALFARLRLRLEQKGGGRSISDIAEDDAVQEGSGGALTRQRIETVTVLVPAFVLTELTEAFIIGFLIFLPFLVIDLIVSNVLMTMGLMMMQPQTIALPLKILLFVLVDGWSLILQGVVLGYA